MEHVKSRLFFWTSIQVQVHVSCARIHCWHRFQLDEGLLFYNLIEGLVEQLEADLLPLGGFLGAVGVG
jgi:hypothetical protein